jgi:hypothetical protein
VSTRPVVTFNRYANRSLIYKVGLHASSYFSDQLRPAYEYQTSVSAAHDQLHQDVQVPPSLFQDLLGGRRC